MKKIYLPFLIILMTLTITCLSSAQLQEEEGLFQNISIKPGISYEYFSRTISWDEDEYTSKLKSYFFTFNTEFEIPNGLSLALIFGYSFTNYDELEFRELPISLELGVGKIGGYLLGSEIRKSFVSNEDLVIDGQAQFFVYLGSKEEWEIPGLSVEGTTEGKSSWMRFSVGPVFTYKGFAPIYPYLYLGFNKLWGKFKMDQTIQDLTGSEDKKISGESSFSTSLGFNFIVTEALSFKAEGNFMPYKDGVDLGFMIKAMYSF
ncbi:MAG: hypothetical protein ISS41_04700 [Candidatus Aminicenantes bacterium]|nr:hypothetical protein [Candidatus Aminicenantes bacterium]